MSDNQAVKEDPLKDISKFIEKLFTGLSAAQKQLALNTFNNFRSPSSVLMKGESQIKLMCHDFCLFKYPFYKNCYDFDYELYTVSYLESERYEWILEHLITQVEEELHVNLQDQEVIKVLYVLAGAFTTETNNEKRQEKFNQLREIMNFIFELNFICTWFNRPSFNPVSCQYKGHLNSVKQKLVDTLPFSIDIECDDMQFASQVQQEQKEFTGKAGSQQNRLKSPLFRSSMKFLNTLELWSIGEPNKNYSNGLLSREMLILLTCFTQSEDVLQFIENSLSTESQQSTIPPVKQNVEWIIKYLEKAARKERNIENYGKDDNKDQGNSSVKEKDTGKDGKRNKDDKQFNQEKNQNKAINKDDNDFFQLREQNDSSMDNRQQNNDKSAVLSSQQQEGDQNNEISNQKVDKSIEITSKVENEEEKHQEIESQGSSKKQSRLQSNSKSHHSRSSGKKRRTGADGNEEEDDEDIAPYVFDSPLGSMHSID